MIVLAAAMLMAGSAAPAAPLHERQALGTCLAKVVHDKVDAKLDAAGFKAAAHTACATQEAAFRSAWTNYYVAMNTKRSEAEEIAGSQADDYFQNEADSYASTVNPAPAKPKGAGGLPVTQASSTTPPKP